MPEPAEHTYRFVELVGNRQRGHRIQTVDIHVADGTRRTRHVRGYGPGIEPR